MSTLKALVKQKSDQFRIDYDPEAIDDFDRESSDKSEQDVAGPTSHGREHYETVGKSRLREPERFKLGKQYKGAAVSRQTFDHEGDDDPLAPVDDDEDSDPFAEAGNILSVSEGSEASLESGHRYSASEGDEYIGGVGVSRRNAATSDQRFQDLAGSEDTSDEETDLDDYNVSDEDSSESPLDGDPRQQKGPEQSSDREKLKALLATDTAAVASLLSTAATADAKKGKAVKQQFQAYDRLLDARIKLQKGLIASNELNQTSLEGDDAQDAVRKAEEAAISLWSTIESLRLSIESHRQTGQQAAKKRKALSPATPSTSSTELWKRQQSLETLALPNRRTVLNKWSAKTHTVLPTLYSRSNQANTQSQITATLDSYLTTEPEKLLENFTPSTSQTHPIYTDDPFYQSLLRDLIAQRRQSQSSTRLNSASHDILPQQLHPRNEAKKKKVDTRASKGRKVRYTVHEKLLNFAAPEDRTTWTEEARREFFGSLLGGSAVLREEGGGDGDAEMDGMDGEEEDNKEVEALRLFAGR